MLLYFYAPRSLFTRFLCRLVFSMHVLACFWAVLCVNQRFSCLSYHSLFCCSFCCTQTCCIYNTLHSLSILCEFTQKPQLIYYISLIKEHSLKYYQSSGGAESLVFIVKQHQELPAHPFPTFLLEDTLKNSQLDQISVYISFVVVTCRTGN